MMTKAQLPTKIEAQVTISRIGGWSHSGLAHMTYWDDLSGEFEVRSARHLYHWRRGIDIYPTPEQFEALLKGESIKLDQTQWA